MRKEVSALVIAGTVCSIAVFALFNSQSASTELHQKGTHEHHELFAQFIAKYSRAYGTKEEFEFRQQIFLKKIEEIEALNSQNSEFGTQFVVNQFTDMAEEEISNLLGYDSSLLTEKNVKILDETNGATIDWRTKGAVNTIQNQGSCGSCWAFSATAAIEGAHAIKTGQLLKLSEQQLVDCSTGYGNHGCNGGMYDYAFRYAQSYPQELASQYAYTARDGSCNYNAGYGKVRVSSFYNVPANNPAQMKAALNQQPVSVAVQANQNSFMSYGGGILYASQCSGTRLDHAITAVGYGADNGVEYFIVRNSWGAGWGESGYIRMQIASGAGTCGVNMEPSYPTTN